MYSRQDLVARYINLCQYAEKKFGMTKLPHITQHMSDNEIVRLGKELRRRVDEADERLAEHARLLGE